MTWLILTAGRGPAECTRAIHHLVQALQDEAPQRDVQLAVLDLVVGDEKHALRSALLSLEGGGAAAMAHELVGTICWTSPSPFRPHHKRKSWFVHVELLAPPSTERSTTQDVVVTTMRASGPGGQHVNKTDSAVRVLHRPTGLVVVAREERSQSRNRALAMAKLQQLLLAHDTEQQRGVERERWRAHDALVRGDAVRTYEGAAFGRKK